MRTPLTPKKRKQKCLQHQKSPTSVAHPQILLKGKKRLSACLVCGWKCCGAHINANPKDKTKWTQKQGSWSISKMAFASKQNFETENQTWHWRNDQSTENKKNRSLSIFLQFSFGATLIYAHAHTKNWGLRISFDLIL